jgi:hypothetical protein
VNPPSNSLICWGALGSLDFSVNEPLLYGLIRPRCIENAYCLSGVQFSKLTPSGKIVSCKSGYSTVESDLIQPTTSNRFDDGRPFLVKNQRAPKAYQ